MSPETKKPSNRRKIPSKNGQLNLSAASKKSNKLKSSTAPRGKPRKRRWVKLAVILCLSLTVVAIVFFVIIDNLVEKRLARGNSLEGSRVFSDIEYFRKGQKVPLDFIRSALAGRNYRSIQNQDIQLASTEERSDKSTSKLEPGEFLDLGTEIRVSTRPFIDPNGRNNPNTFVSISEKVSQDFTLEPQALAALGSADTRASRFLPISKTPKHLINAVLSIEDERFYQHFGIDPIGISRALVTNITKGKLAQGGSTITQQLAKNLFFSPRRSISRKLLEIPAALSLESRLSKQEILEMYLNEVYLGQDGAIAIHGMGEAAHAFFGKNASDLTPSESALLAGLIQAPSLYAPRRFLPRAIKRRNLVLDKMCELNRLESKQCEQARSSLPKLTKDSDYKPKLPFFVGALQDKLSTHLNLEAAVRQGLHVRTGILPYIQDCAEQAIRNGTEKLDKKYPALRRKGKPLEASIVAIEPFSGKIRAWVGGRDFQRSQFDRVSKAKRQIGSTIKPFVYLTALDGSLNTYKTATAISILSDRPMELELDSNKYWNPENYDHEYRGDVTLRYALENSLNIPSVYISQKFGVNSLARVVEKFKLQEKVKDLPALALGALDTNLLNLTAAYGALANGGIYVEPRLYVSAQDSSGSALEISPLEETRVASEGAVFVLTSILEGVVDRGTGKAIRATGYKGPAAGKTGTTNDARDAWFIGYTPELSVGVWLGFDDNKKMGLTGGTAAAPIWGEFMSCVSKNHSLADFVPPPSVALIDVDPTSGLLFSKDCANPSAVSEYFVRGTEPKYTCGDEERLEEAMDEAPSRPVQKRRGDFWEDLFG